MELRIAAIALVGLIVSVSGGTATPSDDASTTRPTRTIASSALSRRVKEIATHSDSPSLRRLPKVAKVGWDKETCTCTGAAGTGGLAFLELHVVSGVDDEDENAAILDSIESTMRVIKAQKGGEPLWCADDDTCCDPTKTACGAATWEVDAARHEMFTFNYSNDGKKVTQTIFQFCLGSQYLDLEALCEGQTCGPVNDSPGCYWLNLHTSCSDYLIGVFGAFRFANGDEVVRLSPSQWGDRQGNMCIPCGNGNIDPGEECDGGENGSPGTLGCLEEECICNRNENWYPDGNGFCIQKPDSDGDGIPGETSFLNGRILLVSFRSFNMLCFSTRSRCQQNIMRLPPPSVLWT